MSKIIISDRVYIPTDMVEQALVKKHWTVSLYKEEGCQRCPLMPERHTEQCDSCPNFEGHISTWRTKRSSTGRTYYALPPGNPKRISRLLRIDLSKAKDKRKEIPFKHKIKFIGKLHDGTVLDGRKTVDQKGIVATWIESGGGIIKSPPRSGKTVMATAAICKVGQRTIIVASKMALLRQFYRTFMGDKKEGRKPMTDLPELEKKTGKTLIRIITKPEQLEDKNLEIALVNYQKFIRNETAKKRINKGINGRFSVIWVDEVHGSGAFAFAKFISRLKVKRRGGLSATPGRKDGRDLITRDFIGPVVAEADTVAMVPEIELLETGVKPKFQYKSWVGAMKYLYGNYDRNKMIVREVFRDLRAGHKAIIIPIDYRKPIDDLVLMINQQAEVNNDKRGETWPEVTAVAYYAGVDEAKILRRINSGKIKVLVAQRGMIRDGIDLNSPSMLYVVVPMSGNLRAGAPAFEQLSYRPCTWVKGKKQPIVKVFVDGLGQSFGCWRSLWWKEILPKLKAKNGKPPKYRIKDADYQRGMAIAGMKEYEPVNEPGVRMKSQDILDQLNSEKKTGGSRLGKLKAKRMNNGLSIVRTRG